LLPLSETDPNPSERAIKRSVKPFYGKREMLVEKTLRKKPINLTPSSRFGQFQTAELRNSA